MEPDITRVPLEAAGAGSWPENGLHGGGDLFSLECAAAVMMHLGNCLLSDGKKIRVTIECDPETGKFKFSRDLIS